MDEQTRAQFDALMAMDKRSPTERLGDEIRMREYLDSAPLWPAFPSPNRTKRERRKAKKKGNR